MSDLRLALRSLFRNPGFSVVVVLTLALGIGANAAIFSLLDAVMLKPLPVSNPEELFALHIKGPDAEPDLSGGTGRWLRFPYPVFQALERSVQAGATLAAMTRVTSYDIRRGNAVAPPAGVQLISGSYFAVFDVSARQGRLITDADNVGLDAHPVAVVSHTYWQQTLGSDPSIVGQTLTVNNVPLTVIGVTDPGFTGPWSDASVSIWTPLMMQHTLHYASNSSSYGALDIEQLPWAPQDPISWLNIVVRAPHGIDDVRTRLEATYRSEMDRLAAAVSSPATRTQLTQQALAFERLDRGFSVLRGQYDVVLTTLMTLVGLVLLIACANIANLLLVRSAARERELRIRLSLGATRLRIVVQLLAEALALAALGTAGALAAGRVISVWIASQLLNVAADALPPAFSGDWRLFAFTAAAGIVSTVVFAVGPAMIATRGLDITVANRSSDAATARRMRPLLVVQIGVALLLGMTAAWFAQSLANVWRLTPGFDPDRLVAVSINPRNSGYTPEELPALYQRLIQAARSVSGVQAAAVAACGLSEGCQSIDRYHIEGYDDHTADGIELHGNRVGPQYFQTLGIRLLEGRAFDEHDVEGAPRVAVITRSLAARYFSGRSPLGKRIGYRPPGREIIGVVEDARVEEVHADPVPMVYVPIAQSTAYAYSLDARVSGNARAIAPMLRQAIGSQEPRLAIFNALALDDRLQRNVTRDSLIVYLTSGFGLLALLLASLGLYGVLAYLVAKRRTEIGVRMALGARPGDVQRMVLADGIRVILAGSALGILAAVVASHSVEPLLFHVSPSDPLTYGVVLSVLGATALAACYVPARRASRVDPVTALRSE